MISLIILALYAIIILLFLITAFFIVYHLVKYADGSELKTVMLVFFVLVSSGLLLSNLALFFSIDWNTLVKNIIF